VDESLSQIHVQYTISCPTYRCSGHHYLWARFTTRGFFYNFPDSEKRGVKVEYGMLVCSVIIQKIKLHSAWWWSWDRGHFWFGLIKVDRPMWVCRRGLGSTGRIMNLQWSSIHGTKGRRVLTYPNFIWAFVCWLRFGNFAFPSRWTKKKMTGVQRMRLMAMNIGYALFLEYAFAPTGSTCSNSDILVARSNLCCFLASNTTYKKILYHRFEFTPFRIVSQWMAFIYIISSSP
jgi:hypothetical protein